MQSQSLTRVQPQLPATLAETQNLGELFCKSGFFADAKQAAQAVVKIMAGAEIGFPPIAAMTGVYIVKGKVSLSANLMAAAIKRSGKYNFKIRTHSAEECKLEFFEMAESVGFSEFTLKEAHAANLHRDWDRERSEWKEKPTWKGFPKNMLFARALSNGAKWFCADIFGGPVYTPDELGATVDGETGEVIDIEPEPVEQKPAAKTPRAALKAAPKAAPVIEAAPTVATVQVMPRSDEGNEERAESWEADDPLPEFEPRPTDETAEEVEAEKQELIAHLKAVSYQCGATDTKWQEFEIAHDLYNKERGWLRNTIEVFEKKAAKIAENTAPVALAEKQARESPGQSPDGKRKQLRKDEDGNLFAVYEGAHMAGRQATHEETIQNLDYWIDYWRTHTTMGQDLATIRAKVARVVGEFHDWSDLKGLELSKAIRVLQEWRPDLDKQTAQKGAKK